MSDSLLSLFKKERLWTNRSCRSLQKSDNEQIPLIFLYAQEQITPVALHSVALFKLKSDSSESLLLLLKKEPPWVNRSCRSLKRATRVMCSFSWANHSFALSLFSSQKTSDSLKKPLSEFPTLLFLLVNQLFFSKIGRSLSKHPQGDKSMPCKFCGL